jgi:hypothetical protein
MYLIHTRESSSSMRKRVNKGAKRREAGKERKRERKQRYKEYKRSGDSLNQNRRQDTVKLPKNHPRTFLAHRPKMRH